MDRNEARLAKLIAAQALVDTLHAMAEEADRMALANGQTFQIGKAQGFRIAAEMLDELL